MSPSPAQLRFTVAVTAVGALVEHFVSRDYPEDWDLVFHIQFAIIRRLIKFSPQFTIEEFQTKVERPTPPVKGIWAIPVEVQCTDSQKEFVEAEAQKIITKLGPGMEIPETHAADLHAEWQGVKRVPDDKAARWTKEEQYAELETDTADSPVILYLHGGAFILCSIETHRNMTARLAEGSNARVFVVNYRLAPQHQFPAALIDAILCYKYLIDPPPGALHAAVDPSKIVIAGDSAGGGLAFALVAFLAHAAPAFPLPAGVILTSPWLDLTHSFLFARRDKGQDYLLHPSDGPVTPKSSPAWPPAEPRYHFYTNLPLHPLVSPVLAISELPPCPPVFITVGDSEYLRDEGLYFAHKLVQHGGKVHLQNYKSMPHVFQIFQHHAATKTCFQEYAKFIKDVTSGQGTESRFEMVDGKGKIQEEPLDLSQYEISFTRAEVIKRMETEVERRRQAVLRSTKSFLQF